MDAYTPREATDLSLKETIDGLILLKMSIRADRDYNCATDDTYSDEDYDAVETYLNKVTDAINAINAILPIVP